MTSFISPFQTVLKRFYVMILTSALTPLYQGIQSAISGFFVETAEGFLEAFEAEEEDEKK